MAIVNVIEPRFLTFEFSQEKSDEDYGTCMWARFHLDLVNYSMFIESDCGNYGYGWCPTPETESFLELCSRFSEGYLIEKLSSKTILDNGATWENLKEHIGEIMEYFSDEEDWDMDELKCACYSEYDERSVYEAIRNEIKHTNLRDYIDDYDIGCCIELDYPAGAKKIEQVYFTHIVPAIRERLADHG